MEPTQSPTDVAVSPLPPQEEPRKHKPVAAAWHTIILIVAMLVFSFMGAKSEHKYTRGHGPSLVYGMTIVYEWVIVGYIYLGTRKRTKIRELVGGRWKSVEDALIDVGLGVGFWIAALAVLAAAAFALGMMHGGQAQQMADAKQKLGFLIPKTGAQLALFFGLSATAGFCEELIFRGYLLRQFAALSGSAIIGLIMQALIFGAGHAYEGGKRVVLITIYGAMFGVLALLRRSLRPGMLAHFFHDASAGVALQKLIG